MSGSRFKYLKPEDIKKLESFEFAPKQIAEGYLAGRHVSRRQGLSTEFRDYRQYMQGNDLSTVDWKVYARTDRHYVRTYEEETNTTCYIFLDSSASMDFGGTLTKLEFSSFFTAALCYLVTKSNNLVSLQIFDDKIRHYFPPGSSGVHLQNLMNILEKNHAGNRTDLSEALRRSFPLLKYRGSLIIISDFFDRPAEIFAALNMYLHAGYKVYLFHLLDPEELELSRHGLFRFADMEDGSRITAHIDSIRKSYQHELARHVDSLRELSQRRNVDYTLARTDSNYYNLFDKLVK